MAKETLQRMMNGSRWIKDHLIIFCRGPYVKLYKGLSIDDVGKVAQQKPAPVGQQALNQPHTPLTSTNPRPSNKLSPVQEFDKGTKRDSGAFPVLKDERFWDDFIRSTKAIARSQCVDNVLNPTYVPTTTDEIELFDRQQAYMYTVVQLTMQTDKGQELVRDYEDTYNAQKVYADITAYHATSTKATKQASELLTHITSNRLGLDTWPSTTEAYTGYYS
jgi:hypothetical protein